VYSSLRAKDNTIVKGKAGKGVNDQYVLVQSVNRYEGSEQISKLFTMRLALNWDLVNSVDPVEGVLEALSTE